MSARALVEVALWCAATVAAFRVATWLHVRARSHPLVNVVLVAVAAVAFLVAVTRTPYATYARSTQPIALLLGPATVALALPLRRSLAELRAATRPVVAGVLTGVLVATASAVGLARVLGLSETTVRSLAPKSVTTPIAMSVAERLGGSASLAAVLVIVTGMLGALLAPTLFDVLRIRDPRARGVALGVAAHGLGTARALQLGAVEAAFSALGMGLSALITPVVAPLLMHLLG